MPSREIHVIQSLGTGLSTQSPYLAYQSSEVEFRQSVCVCVCVCVSHSVVSDCCDPMDCSPPGSSVHGISQASVLEWGVIPFSRGSS